ncbi:MAG TPA: M20 family metallopeptidase [Anaerolineae bacterium]|nr:M20 family metallopeptidase [Anaerolineae bacterium]
MTELPPACRARLPEALALLRLLVALESPSTDKAAVDRCAGFVESTFRDFGLTTRRIPAEAAGDQLLADWPGLDPSAGRILLLLHLDTVWSIGALARMPIREENGRLYGPGVYDMKGSVVIVWLAMRALLDLEHRPRRTLRILFTGDEEIGSNASVDVIRAEARQSDLVLVMEPALPNGELKTARKGVGAFKVIARGRSSHAGGNHEKGVNAIEELAHHILALQKLTDYRRGTTVNVGVIHGGSRSNVVPDRAEIEVDFRVAALDEAGRIERAVQALQPVLNGAELEVSGGLNRPPLERNATMQATFEKARRIAAGIGLELKEGSTGGGSDGNFTAGLGIPTLDGLGAVGDGAHALHEHIVVESLAERAALLAALWMEWA